LTSNVAIWNIMRTMIHSEPASPHPDIRDLPPEGQTAEEREAERLQAEGWPVLRGTAAQRDARFVKALLTAQIALVRGRP
jgi:hypothetical protein